MRDTIPVVFLVVCTLFAVNYPRKFVHHEECKSVENAYLFGRLIFRAGT